MTAYKVELFFVNLDNSLYTNESASATMEITADNEAHACMLASRFKQVFDADYYVLKEVTCNT
jgi:hypothetical protein